jgi:hypothetical protein
MCKSKYYDGTKLLSMLDLDGNKPEIYICTTNRTGGKTTYFGRLCVKRFLDKGEKFALIYRYNYELDDCADKFFKDIGSLFFKGKEMTDKRVASGLFHELFLDEVSCGYAISINSCDNVKKYSHLFSDVQRMIFDEFQTESGRYCKDEVKKFISVHTSIARGQGEQVRYVPVYMLGNPCSIINPYYSELGITERLRSDTKFLRGHGYVLEQGYVESASEAQLSTGFNKAFAGNDYVGYASQAVYLNDNTAFIEKPSGANRYFITLRYDGKDYGIRHYYDEGIIYCDDKPDNTFRGKITVTTDDHKIDYIMLRNNDHILSTLRYYFDQGCFRFKNMKCKEVVLKALSYKSKSF